MMFNQRYEDKFQICQMIIIFMFDMKVLFLNVN